MDWIGKLNKEEQEKQMRQAQTQATKLKQESEEREHFKIVRNKLCPVIEATISELKNRTGFELKMDIGDSSLVAWDGVRSCFVAFGRTPFSTSLHAH